MSEEKKVLDEELENVSGGIVVSTKVNIICPDCGESFNPKEGHICSKKHPYIKKGDKYTNL